MRRNWVLVSDDSSASAGGSSAAASVAAVTNNNLSAKAKKAAAAAGGKASGSGNTAAVGNNNSLNVPKNDRLNKQEFDSIKVLVFDMAVIRHQTEALNEKILKDVNLLTRSKGDASSSSQVVDTYLSNASASIRNVLEQRVRLFAMNLPQFNSLSSHDQILLLENTLGMQLALRILTFFNFEVPRSNGNRYKETHKVKFYGHLFSQGMHKQFPVSLSKLLSDERAVVLISVVLLFSTSGITGEMKNRWECDQVQAKTWDILFKYFSTKVSNTVVVLKRLDDALRIVNFCQDLAKDL